MTGQAQPKAKKRKLNGFKGTKNKFGVLNSFLSWICVLAEAALIVKVCLLRR